MKKIISKLMKSGMTQTAVAKAAGCSQPTIAEILNGNNKNPSVRIGVALARECDRRNIKWNLNDLSN